MHVPLSWCKLIKWWDSVGPLSLLSPTSCLLTQKERSQKWLLSLQPCRFRGLKVILYHAAWSRLYPQICILFSIFARVSTVCQINRPLELHFWTSHNLHSLMLMLQKWKETIRSSLKTCICNTYMHIYDRHTLIYCFIYYDTVRWGQMSVCRIKVRMTNNTAPAEVARKKVWCNLTLWNNTMNACQVLILVTVTWKYKVKRKYENCTQKCRKWQACYTHTVLKCCLNNQMDLTGNKSLSLCLKSHWEEPEPSFYGVKHDLSILNNFLYKKYNTRSKRNMVQYNGASRMNSYEQVFHR